MVKGSNFAAPQQSVRRCLADYLYLYSYALTELLKNPHALGPPLSPHITGE
jgi:hypothetical protein